MLVVSTTMLGRWNIIGRMLRGLNPIISFLKLLSSISNQGNTSNSSFFPSSISCRCYKTYWRYNINYQSDSEPNIYNTNRGIMEFRLKRTKQADATRSNWIIILMFNLSTTVEYLRFIKVNNQTMLKSR